MKTIHWIEQFISAPMEKDFLLFSSSLVLKITNRAVFRLPFGLSSHLASSPVLAHDIRQGQRALGAENSIYFPSYGFPLFFFANEDEPPSPLGDIDAPNLHSSWKTW